TNHKPTYTMNPLQQIIEQIEMAELWEKELVLARNEYLKVQGSIDTDVYFIKSGTLRIFVTDESEEHTIRFAYTNDLIAALDSFITEKPSDLYIQALKKCELKVIGKKPFINLIKSSTENLNLWLQLQSALIYQQMERERDLLTSSPAERYRRVVERSPQLFQEIPNRHIASYLRMTPETLSRIKKS